MIRINLLAGERAAAKKKGFAFNLAGQKMTIMASVILVITVAGIGWRYYSLTNESKRLDDEIAAAQQETARLHSVIQQVQQFEQRRGQLQQRVALIEELRRGQTGPVHMLDQVSRALPPMLWLIGLKQVNADGVVQIDGRATTQTTVSDFVNNLEATGYFKKSIDIVNTTAEPIPGPPGELVRFTLRAVFQTPADAKALAAKEAASGTAPPPAPK
jgi:type IV pilus assembly protein PilN